MSNYGTAQWRSLEQLASSSPFQEMIQREFPEGAAEWADPITRRRFLQIMGASLALAGLSGCSAQAPVGKIVPYVRQPEGLTPGKPLFFATAMTLGGAATGLLVESHEGRPTKVEGNPNHPTSRGATDVFAQASILGLYDPDRSQAVTFRGQPRGWSDALLALRAALTKQRPKRGRGLRVLLDSVTSPTQADQLQGERPGALHTEFPEARWYAYDPIQRDQGREGARLALSANVTPLYHFAEASVVLSLDADFLGGGPGHLRHIREFMQRRRVRGQREQPTMNRLYVVEATPSLTGAVADHRLPLRASEIEAFARALAVELGVRGLQPGGPVPDEQRRWAAAVGKDLKRGPCLVIAGETQPPFVHALAHAMNDVLGNVGRSVTYIDPVEVRPSPDAGLPELVKEMTAGKVELLLVLGGNPVFTAPADLQFLKALQAVPLRFHLGLYQDETAVQCHWHIPQAHFLEAWGDARADDGTVSIVQPLIAPLYGGKSIHEFLAAVAEPAERTGHDIVRDFWRTHWPAGADSRGFDLAWERALHDGVIASSAFVPRTDLKLQTEWLKQPPSPATASGDLEIVFRPDPTVYDGRFANNGWLQELPKPLTRLTWDNAVLVSPATARRLGLSQTFGDRGGEHGQALVDLVRLTYQGRSVEAPVWIMPGQADDCVTVHLGYGRTRAGSVGSNVGFDAYRLRTSTAPWFGHGAQLQKTGQRFTLACVQMHHAMQGREPVRSGTLADYEADRLFVLHREDDKHQEYQRQLVPGMATPEVADGADRRLVPLTLYPPADTGGAKNRWGMAIDLTACMGCSACVIACQAENNIPVVGKTEVTRGREMHWLRVDRYYTGPAETPTTHFQPVPCMQCENAPCELVCPVGATVHSADGLNDMVYNRCVGTRYCSNNCPYKVRRFNFFAYADYATQSLKLGRNPEVTVRSRGVMEKCTYCVQRIRSGQIQAEIEGRPIHDGDVLTACQAACPAEAIVFGDMNDARSRVARTKAGPLNYGLLAELNTRPRTTYLAALRNPNPELDAHGR
jgi:molybdopterin-containing oxidoreductase family iron-sulfur binding subunit